VSTEALARVVAFYESITSSDIARLGELYAADAFFKDPFNEVRGVPAIARIFEHMFVQVDAPRFAVRETVAQGDAAFLVWDFEFSFRRPLPAGPRRIRGCSHLRFDAAGRVSMHRDYWDAAEDLYEQLPVIGVPMRWLRRRAAVAQPPLDAPGRLRSPA
jgi:ketosteroid isomerase-like protein